MKKLLLSGLLFIAGCSEGVPQIKQESTGAKSTTKDINTPNFPDLSAGDETIRISPRDIEDGLVEIPAKEVPLVDAPPEGVPVSDLRGKIGQEVVLIGKCAGVLAKNAGFMVETGDQGSVVISMNGPWPRSVRAKFESEGDDTELGAEVGGILLRSVNGKYMLFEKPNVMRFWEIKSKK